MKLTKQQLIDAGWQDNSKLHQIHQHALSLIENGSANTTKYLFKLLKRDFPNQHAALRMRDQPAPLKLAIEANTKDETKNLNKAIRQINELLRCPVVSAGALMPDACPAGSAPASMPVGGAIAVSNAIIPAAHSADICCSLHASFFHTTLDIKEQIDTLMQETRFGPGGRDKKDQVYHPVLDEPIWNNPFLKGLKAKAASHLADQGDGNHFAFIGIIDITHDLIKSLTENNFHRLATSLAERDQWHVLVTHHGSRSLGATLYTRGLAAAIKQTRQCAKGIPDEAAWLNMDTKQGADYWDALQYVSRWTKANHLCIHRNFLKSIGSDCAAELGNEHNFVWKRGDQYLHGKGATPAWLDQEGSPLIGLIPLNMAEPILLTLGANQSKYLSFSPHGAGRNKTRRAVLDRYTKSKKTGFDQKLLEQDLDQATKGLEVRWYQGRPDITETPIGYKPAETVRNQLEHYNLAEIIAEIKPLGSIMSGRAETFEKPLTPKQLRQMQHRKTRRKTNAKDWLEEDDY